ncbi:MAG: sulfite exporter TauE/SafE family protein [Actinobacteria bacterium]|nr:sulfite exporter TauE/SafE family protein [Actinomycetota bacterium]
MLPIVPAYVSMLTGLEVSELREGGRGHRARLLRDIGLFIAGFSAVFVLLGLSATTIGRSLFENQSLLTRIGGVMVVLMAFLMAASLFVDVPFLSGEHRFQTRPSRLGHFAPPVMGVAFGFGWTPCIGPVLTSVLAIAATQGDAARGALLLGVYSAGLGVPFLVTGLALGRLTGALDWVKRRTRVLTLTSSAVLASLGLLLVLDRLAWATARMQSALDAVGLDGLVRLG